MPPDGVRAHNDAVRLGVYKHYKGKQYAVLMIARLAQSTVSEERLAILIPLFEKLGPPAIAEREETFRDTYRYLGLDLPEKTIGSAPRPKNNKVEELPRHGIYRRGMNSFVFLAIARLTDDALAGERLVIYVPRYDAGGPRVAARPYSNFISQSPQEGDYGPRFEFLGAELREGDR